MRRFVLTFLAAGWLISGCIQLSAPTLTPILPTPYRVPATTPIPPSPVMEPTTIPTPASLWQSLAPGLETRTYTPNGNSFAQIVALRITPALYTFRVHYQPDEPLYINGWKTRLPEAVAFVNANFFNADFTVNGLLVADGQVQGIPYSGYGGMFQVQNGVARVRSTLVEPYGGEWLEQATQAFPMLVLNGTQAYTNPRSDRASRRTIVAEDNVGRIILMATPRIGPTLLELSAYLPTTDMNLVSAVNLDGGGSTMLYVGAGETPPHIASIDRVPAVLAVYPR